MAYHFNDDESDDEDEDVSDTRRCVLDQRSEAGVGVLVCLEKAFPAN